MEELHDNSIRKFRCDQCLLEHNMIKYICAKGSCGYLCEYCWKTFFKRMNEIYFRGCIRT